MFFGGARREVLNMKRVGGKDFMAEGAFDFD